jgi:hypothetical protein
MVRDYALADEHMLLCQFGVGAPSSRSEGFDGVGQRIGTGNGRQRRRTGFRQIRIADGGCRNQIGTGNTDLEYAAGIRNHSNRCYLGPGSGCRWHRDHRQYWTRDLELPVVIPQRSAMRQHKRNALGHVDAASATNPYHDVRAEGAGFLGAKANAVIGHIWCYTVVNESVKSGCL